MRRISLPFILHPSSFILLFLLFPPACTYQHRPARTQQDLLELRAEDRRKNTDATHTIFARLTRSLEMSTRAATTTALRHLHATAEISRLKRHADVQVYTVAIPNDWVPPVPGVFQKETMNALADLGQRMGANPNSWTPDPSPP